jgi:hypothetical protein
MTAKKSKKKPPPPPKPRRKKGNTRGPVKGTNLTYNDDEIIAALEQHCTIKDAASALGMGNCNTIYARSKTNPKVKEAIQNGRRELIAMGEAGLKKLIEQGDYRAIQLVLTTLARKRYATRTESRIGGDSKAPPVKTASVYSVEELRQLPFELRLQLYEHLQKQEGRSTNENGEAQAGENSRGPDAQP